MACYNNIIYRQNFKQLHSYGGLFCIQYGARIKREFLRCDFCKYCQAITDHFYYVQMHKIIL